MGTYYVNMDNHKLLQQSAMLCRSVEPYIEELGLDWNNIRTLGDEIHAMQNITAQYTPLSESFSEINVHGIRLAIQTLINQCLQSINYTDDMGIIIGIKPNSKYNDSNFFEFGYSELWS